jgi:membrane protease YdiL (CAAX protease family)
VATAIWNVLQNRVFPRRAYVPANMLGTVAALGAARWLGLGNDALGLSRPRAGAGLRTGVAVAAPIVAGVLAAERSSRWRRFLHDDRAAAAAPRAVLYETAVRIPLGTALFEETVFRGLLLSWFRSRMPERCAVAASSTLFGLWHVLPTWETMPGYAGGVLRNRSAATAGAALAGAVVVTGLAGVGFSRLRLRSGSLLAPIVVHAAANAAGFFAAWRVVAGQDEPAAGQRRRSSR